MNKATQISKKRKFVADGVFEAELHSLFSRILPDAGYAGFYLKRTLTQVVIHLKATNSRAVLGEESRKIREITSLIQKRFGFSKDGLEIKVEKIQKAGLCAPAQAELLKKKLLDQVPVRTAANAVLKEITSAGAVGAEIIISGKLGQQRAKSMKYRAGYIISTGQPKNDMVDVSMRHVFFKQGMIGVKVKIFKQYDPSGITGVPFQLPDKVTIRDPKQETPAEEIRRPDEVRRQKE